MTTRVFKRRKVAAIVQARSGGTRFPGKVLAPLVDGDCVLSFLLKRIRELERLNTIIVAMPVTDTKLRKWCEEFGVRCFGGPEEDVLQRVLDCARWHDVDVIVDITADCPLVFAAHVADLVAMVMYFDYDYASNVNPRTWPDGFDVQVYKMELLEKTRYLVRPGEPGSAHVGWNVLRCIREGRFEARVFDLLAPANMTYQEMRLTVDTKEDLEVVRKVVEAAADDSPLQTIVWMLAHPEVAAINKDIKPKTPEEG